MTKAISTRVSEETLAKLDEIAEEEHLDRATLLRKMLEEDVEEYLKTKAAESYRKGEKSIEEAAEAVGVSVWEMIEHTQKENINPPKEDTEELEKELKESENF